MIIRFAVLFALLSLAPYARAQASAATVSVSFTPGASTAGTVEHFVEVKGGTAAAPTWTEVAKAAGSPISWQINNPTPGQQVVARVRARLVANPSVVTEPSNEVTGTIPPFRPTDAKISVSVTLTITN